MTRLTTPDLVDCHAEPVHVGDKVRLTKHHAHTGKVGEYQGCCRTVAGWGAKVVFADGTSGFVFRNVEWERVCDAI